MRSWPLLLLLAPLPAHAQIVPVPSRDDPRVQTVRFSAGTPVRLQTIPGSNLTVMLAPGERISSVNISNNAQYQVTLSDARDSFILHTSMVLYQGAPAGDAKIAIISDRGSYELQLSSPPGAQSTYVLRFTYGGSERGRGDAKAVKSSLYKLTGTKALRPASIRDDGSKTYIQWSSNQPIPGVFALDRLGREEMVDGYMRDGTFTIDRIYNRFVFRIDNSEAQAARPDEKVRR